MNRRILIGAVVVIALIAGVLWRTVFTHHDRNTLSGYVDADYVFVTSAVGGVVTEINVARGDQVAVGTKLFALDATTEKGALEQAQGQLTQAEASAANLTTGRRPAEVDAVVAQQAQARAAAANSEAQFRRQEELAKTGDTPRQNLDLARAQRDADQARVRELAAQIRVANQPTGRAQEIRAAESAVNAAKGAVQQAQWRLDQQTGEAPAGGLVVDTMYRPGEVVQPGLPVVQLLPPENLKLRFFVSEDMVPNIRAGQTVRVSCDGCGAPINATVRYVSPRAEFTPPVIYSREQRARLVFLVEAKPTERLEVLHVGQPIDVVLAEKK